MNWSVGYFPHGTNSCPKLGVAICIIRPVRQGPTEGIGMKIGWRMAKQECGDGKWARSVDWVSEKMIWGINENDKTEPVMWRAGRCRETSKSHKGSTVQRTWHVRRPKRKPENSLHILKGQGG